jgi:hypothetical protein
MNFAFDFTLGGKRSYFPCPAGFSHIYNSQSELRVLKEKMPFDDKAGGASRLLPGTMVVVSPEQVSTNLEDEAVILHLKDGVYYGLNPVGARIWNLLQESRTVEEIRDIILEEYEVDQERCEQDLENLLQELLDKGLIELKNGSS